MSVPPGPFRTDHVARHHVVTMARFRQCLRDPAHYSAAASRSSLLSSGCWRHARSCIGALACGLATTPGSIWRQKTPSRARLWRRFLRCKVVGPLSGAGRGAAAPLLRLLDERGPLPGLDRRGGCHLKDPLVDANGASSWLCNQASISCSPWERATSPPRAPGTRSPSRAPRLRPRCQLSRAQRGGAACIWVGERAGPSL